MNMKLSAIKRFGTMAMTALMLISNISSALPVYGATDMSTKMSDYKPSVECEFLLGNKHDYKPHVKDAKETNIYTVMLNGKIVDLSDPIVVRNNTVHLPVRAISDLLGIEIGYSQKYGVAFAADKNTFLEIPVGYSEAVRNEEVKQIGNGNRSILHKDRTYLPLRFISDQFDTVTIDYLSPTKTIAIKTNNVQLPDVEKPEETAKPTATPKPIPSQKPGEPPIDTSHNGQWDESGGVASQHWDDPVAPGQLTPEEVCMGSRHPADIAPEHFKKFRSPEEVGKIVKQADTADSQEYVHENMNYVRMSVDISKERTFLIGGDEMGDRWGLYCGISLPSSAYRCYVMKDGTFVDKTSFFDEGYTIEDLDYFYYTIDSTYFIYDVGTVDTTGLSTIKK